jgi:hypothetical protein
MYVVKKLFPQRAIERGSEDPRLTVAAGVWLRGPWFFLIQKVFAGQPGYLFVFRRRTSLGPGRKNEIK